MKTWQKMGIAVGAVGVFCLILIAEILCVGLVVARITSTILTLYTNSPTESAFSSIPKETFHAAGLAETPTSTGLQVSPQAPAETQNEPKLNSPYSCVQAQTPQEALVSRVIDGDTIEVVLGGTTFSVRYIGIDSPEPQNNEEIRKAATNFNSGLVNGITVKLFRDQSEKDSFDRLLRYVFTDDLFVNLELVKQGMAVAKEYPPDIACASVFKDAEQVAQQMDLGIWFPSVVGTMPTRLETPFTSLCPLGCTEQKSGCDIKGNISSNDGEKIYHAPGQQQYENTIIDPEKGERWFCTEDEAISNGWRKAQQ